MPSEKILIIGLGNPILGDDGVGWVVAHEVESRIHEMGVTAEVDYLSLGGISLMERMVGFEKVILIDSLTTGKHPQGSVITFTLEELIDLTSGHTTAVHDTSLKTALSTGRHLGAILPADKDVHVVAIEAKQVYDFEETLSPVITAAVPIAVQRVFDLLMEISDL